MTSVGGTGRGGDGGGSGEVGVGGGMDADGAVSAGLFIRQFGFSRFGKLDERRMLSLITDSCSLSLCGRLCFYSRVK